MLKIKQLIHKYPEIFTLLGLCSLFYFIFFYNIGNYALMDVDETRYVSMAKDMFQSKQFMTLYLNNEFFFEKPPLFFWCECLSFGLFGEINEFTARFPVALCGTLSCLLIYFLGNKIVSRTYGVVSSLILATSLEFVILSKLAILDIFVATLTWFSTAFGIITLFCKENHKKYFWWLFYIFSALAVMAKGLPGFIIPFGTMFFILIASKKFKEALKPSHLLVGLSLFLVIVLPWHIIMLKTHNPLFFDEYIMKHHIMRFLGNGALNRQQPFWFFIVTILWGFFPWIISTLFVLLRKIQKRDFNFKELTTVRKLLLYSGIYAIFTLIFFSSSDTKLITYILPIYPPLALLGGYIWTNYIERGEYSRIINRTVYAVGILAFIAFIFALFTQYYLPGTIDNDIADAKPICTLLLLILSVTSIYFAKKEKYISVFFVYVMFIAITSSICTGIFFNIDYKFGQKDLMEFAQYAKKFNKNISCYRFDPKYSLIIYGDKHVKFGKNLTKKDLKSEIRKKDTIVIIPNKRFSDSNNLKFKIIKKGRKYTMVE